MEVDGNSFTCRGCLTVETSAVLHPFTNKTVRQLFTSCTSVKVSQLAIFLNKLLSQLIFRNPISPSLPDIPEGDSLAHADMLTVLRSL